MRCVANAPSSKRSSSASRRPPRKGRRTSTCSSSSARCLLEAQAEFAAAIAVYQKVVAARPKEGKVRARTSSSSSAAGRSAATSTPRHGPLPTPPGPSSTLPVCSKISPRPAGAGHPEDRRRSPDGREERLANAVDVANLNKENDRPSCASTASTMRPIPSGSPQSQLC